MASVAVAECQCATWPQATRGRCLIVCGASIGKKNVKCRPCAVGNHTGHPCSAPMRERDFPRVKSCESCGFDLATHRPEDFPS